jgi:5,10-methylenetetrahydromethanopterin reductase
MKIGLMIATTGSNDLDGVLGQIEQAEARGFDSVWVPSVRSFDALTVLALAGRQTSRVELGTFVTPTYPRHPAALAEQALTVQAASKGRLVLGIGLSHRRTMEGMLGFDWSHPIRHMREYLTCLNQLLEGQPASFAGEEFKIQDYQLSVNGASRPQVLVAALGPQLLRLTGRLADGTAVWMGGPRYLAEHAVPTISAAAKEAGRPAPRVLAGLPICVTDRGEEVVARATRAFERYGQLPSYRAVLDREGAAGPADVSLIGDEATVRSGLETLAAAGATDLGASVYAPRGEDPERTYALLQSLKA